MKIYHPKKLIQILLSGIILLNLSGCQQAHEITKEPVTPSIVEQSENLSVEETEKVSQEKEEEVVDTVTNYYEKMIEYMNSEEFKEKEDAVLSYFFQVTDFLFYGSEIKGVTLKELSVEAQLKLVEMYDKVDEMIENRYPDYQEKTKNQMKETWVQVKEKVSDAKEYLNEKVKETLGEEKYEEYYQDIIAVTENWKEKIQKFQDEHGEEIKEEATSIMGQIKEEGSKALSKVNEWYQNFKENHTN